jgi:protein involved in polysaccharide export with SLBB domain
MKLLACVILLAASVFAQSQADAKPGQLLYYLAPSDKITIRAPQAEKLNGKTFQIRPDGFVSLPSVGRLQAGGLTAQALEKQIAKRLTQNSSGEPKVTVFVVGVTAQPKTPI